MRNIETAKLLLEKGAQADVTDERGWSALQCAARDGDLESLKLFLSYGARIRARTGEQSALHDAVYFNRPHVVAFLLASGAEADVNAAGEMGLPIHWAARHGQLQNMKMLVGCRGVNLEAKNWGWGVIQCLLGEGSYYVVQGKPSGWGMASEHKDVALFLLDRVRQEQITGIASQNGKRQTLLHWAAEKGYEEVVRASLRKGVDPNALDNVKGREPMTARQLAVAGGYAAIAELLRTAEENVDPANTRIASESASAGGLSPH
jgi:ankyrin repeat protein